MPHLGKQIYRQTQHRLLNFCCLLSYDRSGLHRLRAWRIGQYGREFELSDLLVQKKLDYAALAKAREEAKQLRIYKANAEMLLRTDADDQRQAREHQQEK